MIRKYLVYTGFAMVLMVVIAGFVVLISLGISGSQSYFAKPLAIWEAIIAFAFYIIGMLLLIWGARKKG